MARSPTPRQRTAPVRPGHQRLTRSLHVGIDLRILDTPGSERTGSGDTRSKLRMPLRTYGQPGGIRFTNRRDLVSEHRNVELKTTRWPTSRSIGRILWLHAGSLRYRIRNTPDVWFGPTYVLPAWWSGPAVVTVQDLVFVLMPERYSGRLNAFHAATATRLSARKACRVICPSRETGAALQGELRVPPEKLVVIPDGVSEIFFSAPLAKDSRPDPEALPYLLFVGTFEARKGSIRSATRSGSEPPHASRPPATRGAPRLGRGRCCSRHGQRWTHRGCSLSDGRCAGGPVCRRPSGRVPVSNGRLRSPCCGGPRGRHARNRQQPGMHQGIRR